MQKPRSAANILLVDHTPAKPLTYEVILAELGETLLKATSAKEALQILLKTAHLLARVISENGISAENSRPSLV